jgi:hypothetical protein
VTFQLIWRFDSYADKKPVSSALMLVVPARLGDYLIYPHEQLGRNEKRG